MMKISYFSPALLIPYENNNKIHDDVQVERIANSIKEFWFIQPFVVDKDNNVIIWHWRLLASKLLNLEEVPVVKLETLTPAQIKKLRILDNKLNESEWNIDNLKLELSDLDFDLSFGELNLTADDLFPELKLSEEEETDVIEDEAPEVEKAKFVKYWDLFLLWNHRLLCWDSTKIEDVETLMDWKQADLLLTDPPYNVDYTWKTEQAMKIENDKKEDTEFYNFLLDAFNNAYMHLKDWWAFYVRYASREVVNFSNAIEDSWLSVKQELIWNKNSMVIWRQDYQRKHEPCLYWWKETWTHNRYSDRKQVTVIDCNRPTKSDMHPTMKPVWLFDYQIKNSSKKWDLVLDLFWGSWTTIIACEQNWRICYMMEYDPKYTEATIKRFHNLNPDAEIKCLNRDIDIAKALDSK